MIMLESLDGGPFGTRPGTPYEVHVRVRARPHPGGGLHPPPTALDATPEKRNLLCQLCAETQVLSLRSGEDPFVAADDRDRGPPGFYSVDFDLGAPDHEVGVHARRVRGAVRELELGVPCEGKARAVCDVAGGILVKEGVEERHAQLTDTRGAVDERDLAEPLGAVVG